MYTQGLALILFCVQGVVSQTTCNGSPCGSNAIFCWDDIVEQWNCECEPGFQNSHPYEVNCTDVDECHKERLHNCRENTYCQNAEGYYKCHCKDGFTRLRLGAGFWRCTDINECDYPDKNNCRKGTVCVNSPGSFTCSCKAGFRDARIYDGQYICSDIDECTRENDNCGKSTRCENTFGSFKCPCLEGYQPASKDATANSTTQDCTDIDECGGQIQMCGNHSACVNTDGSFQCQCDVGFAEITTDGKNCTFVDADGLLRNQADSADLYVGVGIGIAVALILIAAFILIAFLVGTGRKRCTKSINNSKFNFQRQHNVSSETDMTIYEDVGPPLTSVSATVDRRSMRSSRSLPIREFDQRSVHSFHSLAIGEFDQRSLLTHSLVNREFKEALYAVSDKKRGGNNPSHLEGTVRTGNTSEPIYCNTTERAKRARQKVEQACMPQEELYYSSVYQPAAKNGDGKGNVYTNFDDSVAADVEPTREHYAKHAIKCVERPLPNPPIPGVAVQKRKPKRHVISRNSQRVWVSRIFTESEIVALSKDEDKESNPPGHNTYRRLFFEQDEAMKDSSEPEEALAEGTLLQCGGKFYILERDACENDNATPHRLDYMTRYRSFADEAL